MIEVLRVFLRWWATDTFVKTGGILIALGLSYFAFELLSAATVDPFIQFWIGVVLSLCAYGTSWWFQQEPRRAVLWHVAGFLILIATVCWLQFTYTILNPWFVAIICAAALWRLFVRSSEHRSVVVLAAGFFGGALVPPIIFAEFFTPMVTTLSFAAWWGVGLLVAGRFSSWKLFNWLSVTFASLITTFIWLTGISVGTMAALPIVFLLGLWLFSNTLSFHGAVTPKAITSRWYEAATASVVFAALVWIPNTYSAILLGTFALLTSVLAALHYYPTKLSYHPYTFMLASGAFFGAAFMLGTPFGILALSFVWVLYTVWWIESSYKKLLQYTLLLWLVPATLVAWYGLVQPAVTFAFAVSLLAVSTLMLRTRLASLATLYFIIGWTMLIAAVIFLFLPLTIPSAFLMLVVVGLLGALGLIVSSTLALPSTIFLISLGSVVAGLCGVYLLANTELQTSAQSGWRLVSIACLWGGLLVSFFITFKKRMLSKAAVLWTLIVVGSLPTVLLLAWLFVPISFLVSALLVILVHGAIVLRCFTRHHLATGLTPWFLSGTSLTSLALAGANLLLLSHTPASALLGLLATVGAITLVVWTRENASLLGGYFILQYVVLLLTAWLTGLMTISVVAVLAAPSGYSSLCVLGVLTVVSYTLTYRARLSEDWWLHRVSFGVLVLTLGRVLAVEAWRLPDSLVLVPFLLTGIVLISLTMRQKNSAL